MQLDYGHRVLTGIKNQSFIALYLCGTALTHVDMKLIWNPTSYEMPMKNGKKIIWILVVISAKNSINNDISMHCISSTSVTFLSMYLYEIKIKVAQIWPTFFFVNITIARHLILEFHTFPLYKNQSTNYSNYKLLNDMLLFFVSLLSKSRFFIIKWYQCNAKKNYSSKLKK